MRQNGVRIVLTLTNVTLRRAAITRLRVAGAAAEPGPLTAADSASAAAAVAAHNKHHQLQKVCHSF